MGQEGGEFSFAQDIAEYQRNREFGQAGFEVVQLDQDFPLFHPERMTEHREPNGDYPDVPRYMSSVMLDTDGLLPTLPMTITTDGVWKTKGFAITPFEPDAGYPVDKDDFDAASRAAKTIRLIGTDELARHPLNLRVGNATEKMHELGITLDDDEHYFRADVWPVVRALRLQLDFPTGIRLESRPNAAVLKSGEIYFNTTYPAPAPRIARDRLSRRSMRVTSFRICA